MSNKAKVGITVIIAILLLGLVITWKSALLMRVTGYEMIGSFNSIEGLTIGSEIRYRGFKIGRVMRIDPSPSDIKIYCIIDRGIRFPDDSRLRVSFDGLVGVKFLEILPGKSAGVYRPGDIIYGKSTAGLVDFMDIGTQNLVQTKAILETIRNIVERPDIQRAFVNAVLNVEKATVEINKLTQQLQLVARSINNVVSDPAFQSNFKGIVSNTNQTLGSANNFFEGFSGIRVRPSGDVLLGGLQNQVRGNIDVLMNKNNSLKFSVGEGPTRNIALLDLQIESIVEDTLGMRLGMINQHLGGGIDYFMNDKFTISGDIYDVNNPKPSNPKVRLTTDYKVSDYVGFLLQADNFLNQGQGNYSFGVRVTGK